MKLHHHNPHLNSCRSFILLLVLLPLGGCDRPLVTNLSGPPANGNVTKGSDNSTQSANLSLPTTGNPIPNGIVIDAKSTAAFTPGTGSISYKKGAACANGQSQDWFTVDIESQSGESLLEFSATIVPTTSQNYLLNQDAGTNWVFNSSRTIGVSSNCIDVTCGTDTLPPNTLPGDLQSSDDIEEALIEYLTVPNTNGQGATASFAVSYVDGKIISGTINVPITVSGTEGSGCF